MGGSSTGHMHFFDLFIIEDHKWPISNQFRHQSLFPHEERTCVDHMNARHLLMIDHIRQLELNLSKYFPHRQHKYHHSVQQAHFLDLLIIDKL
jgi:hypothetical protein